MTNLFLVLTLPVLPIKTNYFSVTALDTSTSLESLPSNEVLSTNRLPITLSWKYTNVYSSNINFIVHKGNRSGNYTISRNIGTNMTYTWTNEVVIRTNIYIVSANVIITNPSSPSEFFTLCSTTNLYDPHWKPVSNINISIKPQ